MTIDRSARSPAFFVSPSTRPQDVHTSGRFVPFDYRTGPTLETLMRALEALNMDAAPPIAKGRTYELLKNLWRFFRKGEAISLTIKIAIAADTEDLIIYAPSLTLDDTAFNTKMGQRDLRKQKRDTVIDPHELAAEKHNIVYFKLGPLNPIPHDATAAAEHASYNIGTLVNGAGLAMNTIDALALAPHHGRAANFLDTGGKATARTVKQCFELLLADARVRVVFVNIFGGLTLCDMIAQGILLAFEQLGLEKKGVPVVVRLRGTNEKEGQRMVRESGLKGLWAFDEFDEAAAKCVELAKEEQN